MGKIALKDTVHFDTGEFAGDIYLDGKENLGFNALLVTVKGRHYKTRIKNATRSYLVIEGNGTFTVGEKVHTVQKGDLYVIPRGHNYEYEGSMTLFEFNVPPTDQEDEEKLD